MEWKELCSENKVPTTGEIQQYSGGILWDNLCHWMEETLKAKRQMDYSSCSMQTGWNIKYKKKGRSMCTLYPMDGYFIALVVIGNREIHETELALPTLTDYTQRLFGNTKFSAGGRWLMIEVRDEAVLEDVKTLIGIRLRS